MANQSSTWPIDMEVFAQSAGAKADELLTQLLPLYVEDGDLLLSWMEEAITSEDITKLKQAAHRLKGNSASMGVLTVAAIANQLETLENENDLEKAAQLFATLLQEYTKVRATLQGMIEAYESN